MATVVQKIDGATNAASASQATANFSSNPTVGNYILAFGMGDVGSLSTASFTDTLGHTYSPVIAHLFDGTDFIQVDCAITKVASTGTNAVTYAVSGGTASRIGALAVEISGLDATTPYTATDRSGLNRQATPTTATDAVTSGNTPTLSSGSGILIGLGFDGLVGTGAPASGTGFSDHGSGWTGIFSGYRLESKAIAATTATAATFTAAGNTTHFAIAVYLKNAAAGSGKLLLRMMGEV